jgi:hypothetical protein
VNETRYRPAGLGSDEVPAAIGALLAAKGIVPVDQGPEKVLVPPMPGLAVLVDDALFLGRQHLPLLRRYLRGS